MDSANQKKHTKRIKRTAEEQKNYRRSRKMVSVLVALVVVLFILFVDVALIIHHDRAFSETENRVLQTAPELTGTGLTSGRFMSDADRFAADQIVGRDAWIQVKLKADETEGKRESNGVYLGKDGYLMEIPKLPNELYVGRSIDAIRNFADRHDQPVVVALIPNLSSVCPELLPDGAPTVDQEAVIQNVADGIGEKAQMARVLQNMSDHRGEQLYYRTDHHWTSLGARYAWDAIAPYFNLDPGEDVYSIMKLTDTFQGTMASASGKFTETDTIEAFVSDRTPEYVTEFPGSDRERTATIYSPDALETRNAYEVFLGGNYPLVTINTTLSTGRRLLLIKDSYANCLVQFLLPYFDMIQIVDPRYYTDDIDHLMETASITDVLILYNVNTFSEDRYLSVVLGS